MKSIDCIFKKHVVSTVQKRFEFALKHEQVNAMNVLLKEEKDLILIVKIEFKKSIIFQATSLMYATFKIVLIIMSLKMLKKKQCKKLKKIADCASFVLNDDSNKLFNLKRIRQCAFTHNMQFIYRVERKITNA
jgi:hypothetical protein